MNERPRARAALTDAWVSLGLRLRWTSVKEAHELPEDAWFQDDHGRDYYYTGHGMWAVLDKSARAQFGREAIGAPWLGTEAMRHELAHYLIATPKERTQLNFGIPLRYRPTFAPGSDHPSETRATDVERVLDALLGSIDRLE